MEKEKKQFNLKKIFDIASFVAIFVFFLLALASALMKFSGTKFDLFGNRYDVVLTGSMSEKNEKYKDFLKDCNDQYQPFDMVKSKKVEKNSDIGLYDVVIYKDYYVGTNMHRIVGVEENYRDEVHIARSSIGSIEQHEGILMPYVNSEIVTSDLSFTNFEFKVFTKNDTVEDFYNFNSCQTDLEYTKNIENVSGGRIITYNVTRNTTRPAPLYIAYKNEFVFDDNLVISLKINASSGEINVVKDDLSEDNGNLTATFNPKFRYEIRGDKANTSDGFYTIDQIEAKVVKRLPKLGYFVRFMESIWGSVMFITLGFLILGSSIIRDILEKKEKAASPNSNESNLKAEPKEKKK